MKLKSLINKPEYAIYGLLLVYLLIGVLTVTHYGESWDESLRYDYGKLSLTAYVGETPNLEDEKGAFFSMVGLLGSRLFSAVVPGWISMDGWHFMTFLSYLMGVYFFYRICRRLVDPAPAFAATLLFSTQPILWGHGFINPKDAPFMAFFIASVSLGLDMADQVPQIAARNGQKPDFLAWLKNIPRGIADAWKTAPGRVRGLLVACVLAFIVLACLYQPSGRAINQLVAEAYQAAPDTFLGRLFSSAVHASNIGPLESYQAKAATLFTWGFISVETLLLAAGFFLARVVFPKVIDRAVIAGLFLGFCSDIRTLGPAAGLLVLVYFLLRKGRRAVLPAIKYVAAAGITIYAFWPYLWGAPIDHYLASLSQAAKFPWNGQILFAGTMYTRATLPASYLPTLFAVQFTEPAVLLILAGFVAACICLVRQPRRRLDLLLLAAWFGAPVIAAIYSHATLYNNFRQLLFVIPPLFVLCAFSFQAAWNWAKGRRWIFTLLVLASAAPGIFWGVKLHPYEYIYYNVFVGGIDGAFRNYEMEYWGTSYKEDIQYLNQVAPENATVVVSGPYQIAMTYARPDLKIVLYPINSKSGITPDFAILSSKNNNDLKAYPEREVIYQATREHTVLSVVKDLRNSDTD